jgi:hypothetical protein
VIDPGGRLRGVLDDDDSPGTLARAVTAVLPPS